MKLIRNIVMLVFMAPLVGIIFYILTTFTVKTNINSEKIMSTSEKADNSRNEVNEVEDEILTTSTLKHILNVNKTLATFKSVHNYVATIKSTKDGFWAEVFGQTDEEIVDYHVKYSATTKIGIDFEQINIELVEDIHNQKKFLLTLPKLEVLSTNIDITSLDFIFENPATETEKVSIEAYKACIKDFEEELNKEDVNNQIYKLAKENTVNIIMALINPFFDQLNKNYTLDINWEV
ncbi:hypothetical protein AN641_03055 [Candidatus Epulonipiscioides gigas]|nr:hypothetical protein AN641_03055 [Epulopiscium sp. SCG-C07WGA-EpuloA2]